MKTENINFDETTRNLLAQKAVTIKGNQVNFQNPESNITNATIKDAPIELTDETVVETLSNSGRIVTQSMRRGKIRGTNMLTGTRYVQNIDVVNTIPTEIETATTARRSASTAVTPLIPVTDAP